MWVQLKSCKNIEKQGKPTHCEPGDWVDVGKQLALRWIATGEAWVPEMRVDAFMNTKDAGVVIVQHCSVGKTVLGDFKTQLSVKCGQPRLLWTKTLFWNPQQRLQTSCLPIGYHLLETWQVVCPLLPYERLANTEGGPEEQARTKAVIHDLRVPLYNPDLLFVKRCDDTEYLMNCWDEERVDSGNQYLSLLRAIYRAKPLILALPCTWTHPQAVSMEV